jgi:hypothetical protein
MNKEIEKQINKLQADLDMLKELANEKPRFEVGKWYKRPNTKVLTYMQSLPEDKHYKCFGFDCNGNFFKDGQTWLDGELPATDSEVLATFTTYFRSQGFKEGSRFNSVLSVDEGVYHEPLQMDLNGDIFGSSINGFKFGWMLFRRSTITLVTLIEDEKIMVGGIHVKFEYGNVWIQWRCFTKEEIEAIKGLTPSGFSKILKRMEG